MTAVKKPSLFVDVHIIQDVPPANLNRDDSGSPKTARYGGVDRLRVSSQAWKRATRKAFTQVLDQSQLGVRTRRMPGALAAALTQRGMDPEQAPAVANALLTQIKLTASQKKAEEGAYLFFYATSQLEALAEAALEHAELAGTPDELAKAVNVADILGSKHSLDVALFGRMVADMTNLNVDAACQVAHALSTHAAGTQFDYFTAVDDLQGSDEAGAGMIGTIEYNSATLYRYASINVDALVANMADEEAAIEGVSAFVEAFTTSMPTGKQNTFAAHTRPALVWLTLRHDQVNWASAFEEPVKASGHGYVSASLDRLASFAGDETKRWGDVPIASLASYTGEQRDTFGDQLGFREIITQLPEQIRQARADD